MSEKKQLLDPIGTMCKIVSLIFCDKHTKISIQDHILSLQPPSGYQGFLRRYNGDGRENISELYYVIIRLIKWYIVPRYTGEIMISSVHSLSKENILGKDNILGYDKDYNKDYNKDTDDDISDIDTHSTDSSLSSHSNQSTINRAKKISQSDEFIKTVNYMCDAFCKLQETYEDGNVVLALQFYINLLKDAINGKYTDDRLPRYILEKDKEYETLIDYNKLMNLWDVEKIRRITQLYDDCMTLKDDIKLSEKTRESLIKGNLSSIYSILDDCDNEFKKLIQNSNRG